MAENIVDIVREFLEFRDRQKAAYLDALSGFSGYRRELFRQVAYVNVPSEEKGDETGMRTVVGMRLEDPTSPDPIINVIKRASDCIAENSPGGANEQQLARAVLVFLFTSWELEYRPRLAAARGIEVNDVKVDIMGDLRILRNAILHKKGVLTSEDHGELRALADRFKPGQLLHVTPPDMDRIFKLIDRDAMKVMVGWGVIPPPPFPVDSTAMFAIGPQGQKAQLPRSPRTSIDGPARGETGQSS